MRHLGTASAKPDPSNPKHVHSENETIQNVPLIATTNWGGSITTKSVISKHMEAAWWLSVGSGNESRWLYLPNFLEHPYFGRARCIVDTFEYGVLTRMDSRVGLYLNTNTQRNLDT